MKELLERLNRIEANVRSLQQQSKIATKAGSIVLAEDKWIGIGDGSTEPRLIFSGNDFDIILDGADSFVLRDGASLTLENPWENDATAIKNDGGTGVSRIEIASTMWVEELGSVGIGTDSPEDKLHVESGVLRVTNSGRSIHLENSGVENLKGYWSSDVFVWRNTDTAGTVDDDIIMSWDAPNGRVGIGTDSPGAKFHVETGALGHIAWFTGAGNERFTIYQGSAGTMDLYAYDNVTAVYSDLRLRSSANAGIVIDTGDRVGIGTNSPNSSYKMNIVNTNRTWAMRIQQDNSTGTGCAVWKVYNSPNPTDYILYFIDGSSTHMGHIRGDGAGGVNYNSVSDESVKDDIRTLQGSLAKIKAFEAKTYRGKGGNKQQIGFVAQDVLPHVPEAVTLDEESGMYGIDYGRLSVLAIAGLKELEERVSALETNDGPGNN